MTVTVLKEDCKIEDAADRKLPYTCYLVEYKKDGETKYDLAMCQKEVDLFDHYYDAYKMDFVTFKQSGGMVKPSQWNVQSTPKPKPKRKRREEE